MQENNLDHSGCCESEAGPGLRSSDSPHQDLILFFKFLKKGWDFGKQRLYFLLWD